MSNDIAAQLRPVLVDLAGVVGSIDERRLHDPTPCTEMDVQALRDHVVGWLTSFAAGATSPDGTVPDLHSAPPEGDPAELVRDAAGRLEEGIAGGAAQRPMVIGESSMPGDMSLSMILWEYQVHGWDLARATGQAWDPPADGVEASLAFAPNMLTPEFQGEGKTFGPRVEVAEDAPPLDRLLGLSGRDPAWGHRSGGESGTRPS